MSSIVKENFIVLKNTKYIVQILPYMEVYLFILIVHGKTHRYLNIIVIILGLALIHITPSYFFTIGLNLHALAFTSNFTIFSKLKFK